MRFNKIVSALAITLALSATFAQAASIGRSGGGSSHSSSSSAGRSSSSSISRSYSAPAPSKPAPSVAPAPAKPGGIGGTTSSVGVRKSEVTNGVRNDIAQSNPNAGKAGSFSAPNPSYTPTPSYGYATPPQPSVTNGSTFMSSLGGSFVGSALGNMIFGSHGHGGGTTVINNGTPGGSGVVASGPGTVAGDAQFNPGGVTSYKKEYTVWSFIGDVIGFVILLAVLAGLAWLVYKGYKFIRNYINKERGVSTQPFNPTQQFWRIQRAFAEADVIELRALLGPDVVDELTNGITASTLSLSNVSHEVRLENATELSIWYKFEDAGEEVNQVWHYEKFGKDWKLNGIENV